MLTYIYLFSPVERSCYFVISQNIWFKFYGYDKVELHSDKSLCMGYVVNREREKV